MLQSTGGKLTSALKFVSHVKLPAYKAYFIIIFCNNCTKEGDEHFDLNKLLGRALLRRDSRVTKTNKRTIVSPKVSKLRRQLWTGRQGGVCDRVVNTSNSGSGGPGSCLARRVVSLDKEVYSNLSLFTQVYLWVPATHWGGG